VRANVSKGGRCLRGGGIERLYTESSQLFSNLGGGLNTGEGRDRSRIPEEGGWGCGLQGKKNREKRKKVTPGRRFSPGLRKTKRCRGKIDAIANEEKRGSSLEQASSARRRAKIVPSDS